jgi:hypothetical protein
MSQKHIILGRDRHDAEAKPDTWLSEHPKANILRVHPPKAEPDTADAHWWLDRAPNFDRGRLRIAFGHFYRRYARRKKIAATPIVNAAISASARMSSRDSPP